MSWRRAARHRERARLPSRRDLRPREPLRRQATWALRAADVHDAGIVLTVQRMVDGMVSASSTRGIRSPATAASGLVRAGYGLASAVRSATVPSDMFRLARDGYLRDSVIAAKNACSWATPDARRETRQVPETLVSAPRLSEPALRDVVRLAERAEKHVGSPLRVEWALLNGKVYLLRCDPLPGPNKRRARPRHQARGAPASRGPTPSSAKPCRTCSRRFAWSLLYRSIASAWHPSSRRPVSPSAPRPSCSPTCAVVRISTWEHSRRAVCRLPGLSPPALARVGVDLGTDLGAGRAGGAGRPHASGLAAL